MSWANSASKPILAAHPSMSCTASARRGEWKPTSTRTGSNVGLNTAPPRNLFLRSAASASAICWQYSSKRASCSGVPAMTAERRPLRTDSAGCGHGLLAEFVEQCGDSVGVGVGDRDHRRTVAEHRDPAPPAPPAWRAAPISCASASSSTSLAPAARSASTASTPWECPATATGGVAAKSIPWRVSARIAATWVSRTPGSEHAADISCSAPGTGSSAARARTHRSGSKPDRADHDQFPGDRLQHHFGLGEQRRQLVLDAGLTTPAPRAFPARRCPGRRTRRRMVRRR